MGQGDPAASGVKIVHRHCRAKSIFRSPNTSEENKPACLGDISFLIHLGHYSYQVTLLSPWSPPLQLCHSDLRSQKQSLPCFLEGICLSSPLPFCSLCDVTCFLCGIFISFPCHTPTVWTSSLMFFVHIWLFLSLSFCLFVYLLLYAG